MWKLLHNVFWGSGGRFLVWVSQLGIETWNINRDPTLQTGGVVFERSGHLWGQGGYLKCRTEVWREDTSTSAALVSTLLFFNLSPLNPPTLWKYNTKLLEYPDMNPLWTVVWKLLRNWSCLHDVWHGVECWYLLMFYLRSLGVWHHLPN